MWVPRFPILDGLRIMYTNPLPFVAIIALCWLSYYDVEHASRNAVPSLTTTSRCLLKTATKLRFFVTPLLLLFRRSWLLFYEKRFSSRLFVFGPVRPAPVFFSRRSISPSVIATPSTALGFAWIRCLSCVRTVVSENDPENDSPAGLVRTRFLTFTSSAILSNRLSTAPACLKRLPNWPLPF